MKQVVRVDALMQRSNLMLLSYLMKTIDLDLILNE